MSFLSLTLSWARSEHSAWLSLNAKQGEGNIAVDWDTPSSWRSSLNTEHFLALYFQYVPVLLKEVNYGLNKERDHSEVKKEAGQILCMTLLQPQATQHTNPSLWGQRIPEQS